MDRTDSEMDQWKAFRKRLVNKALRFAVMPAVEQLDQAHQQFVRISARDLFYRAAVQLADAATGAAGGLTLGEALGVLLRTWNRRYYQRGRRFVWATWIKSNNCDGNTRPHSTCCATGTFRRFHPRERPE